jgi:glutamyl-tRNA reductase
MMVVVGLSHKTAPVEIRERLAIPGDALPDTLRTLVSLPAVGEAMCISTCNRVEVIATPRNGAQGIDALGEALSAALDRLSTGGGGQSIKGHLYCHRDRAAALHLFRVASSLDSIVVGEPHILGQVKDAFETAQSAGTVGPVLSRVVSRALHAAKRVRAETSIGEGMVSVPSVAVDLAQQIFSDLTGRQAMLVGAGEMAETAAQALIKAGAKVLVVNRSLERAAALASKIGASPRPWSELEAALAEVDVVISSTASRDFVLPRALVQKAQKVRKGRTLFLIDIAVPRDIEPSVHTLDNVFLYDVDDLEGIVKETQKTRQSEADRAEILVVEEARSLEAWVEARGVTPTIVGLRAKTKATLMAELDRSLAGKLRHLNEADRAALAAMVEASVNKLLHGPTSQLRRAAAEPRGEQMAQVVRELFDLPEVSVVGEPAQPAAEGRSEKRS